MTYALLRSSCVSLISARDRFIEHDPDPYHWKTLAFRDLFTDHFDTSKEFPSQLVVVGDSFNDVDAGLELFEELHLGEESCQLRTVKLKNKPTVEELLEQLSLLNEEWHSTIVHHNHEEGDLEI